MSLIQLEIIGQQRDGLGNDRVLHGPRRQIGLGDASEEADIGRLGGGGGFGEELVVLDEVEEQRSDRNEHAGGCDELEIELHAVQTQRVVASRGDQREGAVDDLDQRVDERLEGLFEGGLADHVGPQTKTIHELPVVHEVNAGKSTGEGKRLLLLCHRCRGVENVNGELANVHEGVLVGRHGIQSIELGYAVTHHGERLVGGFRIQFATLHKGEVNILQPITCR